MNAYGKRYSMVAFKNHSGGDRISGNGVHMYKGVCLGGGGVALLIISHFS